MRLDAPAVCSLHILWTFDRCSTGPWWSHFCAGAQWMGPFRTQPLPPHTDPGSDSHACVLAQILWNSLSLMLPQYFLFICCDSVACKSPWRWLCCGPLRSRPWDQQLQIFTLEIVPGNTFGGVVNVTGKGRRLIQEAWIVRQLLWAVGSVSLGSCGIWWKTG